MQAATWSKPEAGALESVVERAVLRWPELDVEREAFLAHLSHLAGLDGRRPRGVARAGSLASVHAEDLYLAFACARGDPKAHAELDALYLERVERELRRKPMLAPFAQDAIQRLRQKLLVGGEGGGPKLLDYAGAGPLLALVRAAALRQAINLRRARLSSGKQVPVDESTSLLSPDPELAFLKAHYREPFQAAFREALAALSDEMVNVLRLHLVDGLNIDRIGALYGAHRATAARWIAATRRELLEGTRARLAARLRLGAGEVDSLLRLLCSQLDLSLRGALAGGAA